LRRAFSEVCLTRNADSKQMCREPLSGAGFSSAEKMKGWVRN
jgi:hypothetical protein